jgi:hypothetical protein
MTRNYHRMRRSTVHAGWACQEVAARMNSDARFRNRVIRSGKVANKRLDPYWEEADEVAFHVRDRGSTRRYDLR